MDKVYHKRTRCRACDGERFILFASLGPQPLANGFIENPAEFENEAFYPLDLYFCETCSLVQLLDVIHPETLFRNYIYVTGTSATMQQHFAGYAREVIERLQVSGTDLVVEAASNDGSLLEKFDQLGTRTLGVEPARNLAELSRGKQIETLDWFFDRDAAARIRALHGPAKAVIANNVLAHVDNPRDFLAGARDLISEDGAVVFEVPYLLELLGRVEYDTVYHEHLCYFSAMTLMTVCENAGLWIDRIDRVPVHGGSLRVWARRNGGHSEQAVALAATERSAGMDSIERYRKFAREVEHSRASLRSLLCGFAARGKAVAGYGAPAKGNTLLNYCGIDTSLLRFTVDKNLRKVGLYTPGQHIPIRPVSALVEQRPDYVVILAWNLSAEIMLQQKQYREMGGRFVVPVPEPAIHG